jgi:hypothetical protein
MTERTLSCKELTIGLRVILTDPDPGYNIGPYNPKIGTKWECVGTVTNSDSDEVEVRWDNGSNNIYKDFDLSAAIEGRFKSIW